MKEWEKMMPCGLILEPGNSVKYKTGDWRSKKPVVNKEKCTSCLLCFINCPDSSIMVEKGKFTGIDYEYCKGCGICAEICPTKCIHMEEEG